MKHVAGMILFLLSFKVHAFEMDFSKYVSLKDWMQKEKVQVQKGNIKYWQIDSQFLTLKEESGSTALGWEFLEKKKVSSKTQLEFEFEVLEYPQKGNICFKKTEDSPLRIFVLFDKGKGIFSPPHTLSYAFDASLELKATCISENFSNVRNIVIGNPSLKGKKVLVTQNIAEDYKKLFKEEAPQIVGMGIKSDGNDTKENTLSKLYFIRLKE